VITSRMRVEKKDVSAVLPKRRREAHKGDYGRLLVIGGGSRYVGAPALVGLAALRSGVDLAIIAAPEKAAWTINSFSPDLITIKLPCRDLEPSALSELRNEFKSATAVVVGSGLGTLAKTRDAVLELARTLRDEYPGLPTLFDADGLKALASERGLLQGMPWVLTPHAREFELLTGVDLPTDIKGRAQQVKAAAKELGCSVLLKAWVDVIASPAGEVKLNYTGNSGMTVGGTGDVLAGVVGAFLAQGVEPFKAAVVGAWACGRAGDMSYKERGYELLASDMIEKLPAVFKEVRRRR
jgi:NAD(P)H-hydrate epimerase